MKYKRTYCHIKGCGRRGHSGSRWCAGHAKRIERGKELVTPLKPPFISMRDRCAFLSRRLANAKDEAATERAWEALEKALRKWADEFKARQGGKARAASLSPERRSEIASNAVKARWRKVEPKATLKKRLRALETRVANLEEQLG